LVRELLKEEVAEGTIFGSFTYGEIEYWGKLNFDMMLFFI
jgi:hypothetical protein